MTDDPSPPPTTSAASSSTQSPVFSSYQTRLLARSNSGILARSQSNSKDLTNLLTSPPSPRKLGSGSAAALALSGAKVGRAELGEKSNGHGLGHARSAKSVDLVRGQWEQRAAETPGGASAPSPRMTGRNVLWEQNTGNGQSQGPASTTATPSPTHRRTRSALPASLAAHVTGNGVSSPVTTAALPASTPTTKPSIGLGKPPRAPAAAAAGKEDPLQEIARQVSASHPRRVPSTSETPLVNIQAKEPARTISLNATGSSIAMSEASVASTSTSASVTAPKFKSAYMAQRAAKRASATSTLTSQFTGESDAGSATPRSARTRLSSLSGVSRSTQEDTSHLSNEEKLAIARANALARLEAKKASHIAPTKAETTSSQTSIAIDAPVAPPSLAAMFTPPRPTAESSVPQHTPPASYRSIVTPPSAPPLSNIFTAPSNAGGKYGSISRSDKRKLGRHLPRIASGDGYDEEPVKVAEVAVKAETLAPQSFAASRPSGLSARPLVPDVPASPLTSTPSTPSGLRPGRFAATARLPASAPRPVAQDAFETPTKIAPNFTGSNNPNRRSINTGLGTPKIELDGEGMRGLMSAVGGSAARGAEVVDDEAGLRVKGRLRLSKLPLPASSAALAPAPLPSKRLMQNTNWMDRQRHAIAAYEYLCHVGEAQQWIEGCLEEELSFGVTEMEEGLRDGVVLARLAKVYEGDAVKIWTEVKHRFRQSDNINYFLSFVRKAGLPETFIFELTDLYDKKNIPKVIYCVHVLSHLLARQGRADRISNLVGQFEFTDEQLAATQKGLQGVAMPNFGSVGNALAKDMKWEEEEEVETEDERRDRELLACQFEIINLQSYLRGRLATMKASQLYARLDLAQPIIVRFQARSRGAMSRRALLAERDARSRSDGWAAALQATARSGVAQRKWRERLAAVQDNNDVASAIQAHARGRLQRLHMQQRQTQLRAQLGTSTALQATARAKLVRDRTRRMSETLAQPSVATSVLHLQAVLRGKLQRQAIEKQVQVLAAQQVIFCDLQSQIRGALVRRGRRIREQKLDDASNVIVSIQATARGALARRHRSLMKETLKQATSGVTTFQAAARARLAKQTHHGMQKALAKVEHAGTVGGLQAFLRTKLAKKSTTEQKKQLEFLAPDVIGFQAAARGCLQRREFAEWRDYLIEPHTQGALIFLQSLIRGFLARRRLWLRTSYIHANIPSIVKVQALQRGRLQRQPYEKLMTGSGVDVRTIQHFMHLLNDTEADFREQVAIDTLRDQTVEIIRENRDLEADVDELDTKISLVVRNKLTFEDLVKAKRRTGAGRVHDGDSFHVASSDPFSGSSHLDRGTLRKLELFQFIFFMLQIRPEYLVRLLSQMPVGLVGSVEESDRRLVESCVLSLFGFVHTQAKREAYLYHKLLQVALHQEILTSASLDVLLDTRFALTNVTAQYLRPAMSKALKNILSEHVLRVVEIDGLDLGTDPVEIYLRRINEEESMTGIAISHETKPRDLTADQVLQADPDARAVYIQHLQQLRAHTDAILQAVMLSTDQLPYSIRMLARECLLALRVKYPDAEDFELIPIVANTVVLPYIVPAIIAPEVYDIVAETVDARSRRNLKEIARLLTMIFLKNYALESDRFMRVPLTPFLDEEHDPASRWIFEVADVKPIEAHFEATEVIEASREARPVSITRSELYGMLSVMKRHAAALTTSEDDSLAAAVKEIDGAPLEFDRTTAVQLRLSNRLAHLPGADDRDINKADLIQAKRHVLAVLRVQTGPTLFDVLITTPDDQHECIWAALVHEDMALDTLRHAQHPSEADGEYVLESIRSLRFRDVKSRAIEYCIRLERSGRLQRDTQYQGLLASVADDIRQKHGFRKSRALQLKSMQEGFASATSKKRKLQEQFESYNAYIDTAMASLQQQGKKRTVLPFSRQYFHQKQLAKSGRTAKFGSFKYTAAELYDKGVILSVNQFSPRQFDKLSVVISSDEVGAFSIELSHPASSSRPVIGSEEVRMEDLLTAQFENTTALQLFNGMATVNLNTLIYLINRKFYA